VLNFYHRIFENCNILFYVSPGKPKVECQKRFFARELRTSTPTFKIVVPPLPDDYRFWKSSRPSLCVES